MKETKYILGGNMSLWVFLTFLILKVTETIDWSWWVVTLPLWLVPALAVGYLLIGTIIAIIVNIID